MRRARLVLGAGGLILLCLVVVGTMARVEQREQRALWRLPSGLEEASSRLTHLELTGPVDRLDWVGPSLEELVLRGSAITILPDLSGRRELRRLTLQGTPIEAVGRLPPDLRVLELRDIEVQQFVRGWPDSIEQLELGGSELYDPGPFPTHLRRLSLQGREVRDVEELPPSVNHLTLVRTDLAGLPEGFDHLVSLELRDNPRLVVESLPDSLLALTLRGRVAKAQSGDGQEGQDDVPAGERPEDNKPAADGSSDQLTCRDLPSGLQVLRLLSDALPCPHGLPTDLNELHLSAPSRQKEVLDQLTAKGSLTRVRLDYATGDAVELLPDSVESLELHGYLDAELPSLGQFPNLRELVVCNGLMEFLPSTLPEGLEVLRLCGSEVELPVLPTRLRELSLASTRLRELPDLGEVVRLRKLDVSGSCLRTLSPWPRSLSEVEVLQLSTTDLTDLPPLPPSLQVLDISNTFVRQLDNLPENLEELTLHLGQVQNLHELPSSVRRLRFVPHLGDPGAAERGQNEICR